MHFPYLHTVRVHFVCMHFSSDKVTVFAQYLQNYTHFFIPFFFISLIFALYLLFCCNISPARTLF